MDLADAECVLEDLVSKGCVVAVTRKEFDEAGAEGGVSRIDKVDLRPEAGQTSEGGATPCAHDVDEAALHARVPDVGRPLVFVQRSAPSREAFTKN